MNKLSYEEQTRQLIAAIDIAVTSFELYSPKNWDNNTKQHIVNTYISWKNDLKNPNPKFKNKKSLSFVIVEVLTYFQESSGEAVNYFWQQIENTGLDFKRENKLNKIIKRKKIKTLIEYDFIIDVLVPYQQVGLINDEEVKALNKMLLEFEDFHSKNNESVK